MCGSGAGISEVTTKPTDESKIRESLGNVEKIIAIANVTYDIKDFLKGVERLDEGLQKDALYNAQKLDELEGIFLVTNDCKLKQMSIRDKRKYNGKVPEIEAKVDFSTDRFIRHLLDFEVPIKPLVDVPEKYAEVIEAKLEYL